MKMSTTWVWGEADEEDKVRHAQGRPLYEMGVNILGWNWGKWMAGGFKVQGNSSKFSVYKLSDGGKRKWVPHGFGVNQMTGIKSDMLRRDPSMKWV